MSNFNNFGEQTAKKVAFCGAVFAGFAYVGYSIIRSAFCTRSVIKEDVCCNSHLNTPKHSTSTRGSQTDLSLACMGNGTSAIPNRLEFTSKTVKDRVKEMNLKARLFTENSLHFIHDFRPSSLQNSPWSSPRILSSMESKKFLSYSAENLNMSPPSSPRLRRKSGSPMPLSFSKETISEEISKPVETYSLVEESEEILYKRLNNLYKRARVMTPYEARSLVTLLHNKSEDILIMTITTISNLAAFTVNQGYLFEAGCPLILRELLTHHSVNVQVATTQAIANLAITEKNQRIFQPCIPALLQHATVHCGEMLRIVSLTALANLALDNSNHSALMGSIHKLFHLLDIGSNMVRLQTSKLLVNISCNTATIPTLLANKAPRSVFQLLDMTSDRDVALRWVTFLANLVTSVDKLNIQLQDLPSSDPPIAMEDTIFSTLYLTVSRDTLIRRLDGLRSSLDEDISKQANRMYDVLNTL